MTYKKYPPKNNTRTLELCTCGHGGESHNSRWVINWGDCKKCECPKYELNFDTVGDYIECVENEAEISNTNTWSGCKTFYKKVR